jgi:hypothetical protein
LDSFDDYYLDKSTAIPKGPGQAGAVETRTFKRSLRAQPVMDAGIGVLKTYYPDSVIGDAADGRMVVEIFEAMLRVMGERIKWDHLFQSSRSFPNGFNVNNYIVDLYYLLPRGSILCGPKIEHYSF